MKRQTGNRGAGAIAPEEPMLHQLLGLWSRDGSMLHQLSWLQNVLCGSYGVGKCRTSTICTKIASGVAKGGQSGQLPPPIGGLDSENFIVESVVHTAELDVFFNHL